MLNAHLFLVKWLGCQIVESNIPISPGIDTFSEAIMNKPHQDIWLSFGMGKHAGSVDLSDIDAASFASGSGTYDYLCRLYQVDRLQVRVRFSSVKLKDDWHPNDRSRLAIADLTGAEEHK